MDFSIICRLCLKVPPSISKSIFDSNLAFLVESLTSLKVSKGDKLPVNVCETCAYELQFASDVKDRILESSRVLHLVLNSNIKVEVSQNKANVFTSENHIESNKIDFPNIPIKNETSPATDDLKTECDIKVQDTDPLCTPEVTSDVTDSDNEVLSNIIAKKKEFNIDSVFLETAPEESPTLRKCRLDAISNVFRELKPGQKIDQKWSEKRFRKRKSLKLDTEPVQHNWKNEFTVLVNDEEVMEKTIKNGVATFFCKICEKPIETNAVALHKAKHKQAVCKTCGIVMRADNIKTHILDIHKPVPQICDICGAHFKAKGNLRSHIFMYHKQRTLLKCEICNHEFRTNWRLNIHKRSHTGEKPHQCDYCSKCFNGSNVLKKHINSVHLKKRDHICDFCKKEFSSKYALMTHRRQHTGEVPYPCAYCSESFRQFVSLRTHLKSKHNLALKTNKPGYTYSYQKRTLEELMENSVEKKCVD